MMRKVFIGIGIIAIVVIFIFYVMSNDSDVDSIEGISYRVPSEFEKSKYGEYYHYYGDKVSCDFDVRDFSLYSYKSGKEYLENNVIFHLSDDIGKISEIELNGDMWYFLGKKNSNSVSYYYATVKDNIGYYMEYVIRDYYHGDYSNDENNYCMVSYDKVISSVKLK